MTTDWQELWHYSTEHSEESFRKLVNRHLGLVYSTAFRQTRNEQLAKDIAQIVFTNLALRAKSLKPEGTLAGWLHQDTRFTALRLLRQDRRRVARECEAATMQNADAISDLSPDWSRIRPALDAALAQLSRLDREALLLRYFEERSLREIGAALDIEEDTARKRVSRAIEKLREVLSRQGIHTTSQLLSASLLAHAVQATPMGLAATVVNSALAAGGAAAGALTTSTLIQSIAMTKLKASVAAVVVAASISTPLLVQRGELKELRKENAALRDQATQMAQLPAVNEQHRKRAQDPQSHLGAAEFSELLRLRGEIGLLRQLTNELTNALRTEAERSRAAISASGIVPEPPLDIASAKAVIFDPNADLSGKLEALRVLRFADARSDDVVRQMVQVYYATTNAHARADIFRQLHGTAVSELKGPLLQVVSDPNEHPELREEAAETLDGYLGDSDAKAWLEHLAQHDPDAKVRDQAGKSLARQ